MKYLLFSIALIFISLSVNESIENEEDQFLRIQCGDPILAYLDEGLKKKKDSGSYIKIISVAFETDWCTVQQLGGVAEAEAWVRFKYQQFADLYAKEGISTALTEIRYPSSAGEDWASQYINNPFTLLNEYGELRKNTPKGRLKAFVSMCGPLSSVAWLGTLEDDYSTWVFEGNRFHGGPYSVSLGAGVESNYYQKTIMTHEVGHNLGSQHTHGCHWGNGSQRIDNCVNWEGTCPLVVDPTPQEEKGTIMSYCHLVAHGSQIEKGFGIEPRNRITGRIDNVSRDMITEDAIILNIAGEMACGEVNYIEEVIFHQGAEVDELTINKI